MARLIDEKVDMARQLGADGEFVQRMHQEEISRQIMLGSEGLFFLVLIITGAWLIYRALVKTSELKFHQENFIMAVTHELKTPLASIRIYLDALASTKITAEKKAPIVPRIRSDLDRLERLVENVLDAGRFDRHGYRLNPTDFDFSRLVNDRLDQLLKNGLEKRVKITRELPSGISVCGDERALARALDAVLENGLTYNDREQVEFHIAMQSDERSVRLKITDNGIGLSKENCVAVFNRFYRVGDEIVRGKPGSGLGLYLTREIIRAHGGDITASSDGIGHGSTFEITLKLKKHRENNSAG